MGWRNGAKLSSGGFAEGFAAGFVPAYTAKLDNERQKERDEANRAHEMEMMTVKEQMISQREKMKSARGAGNKSKGDADNVSSALTFLEMNGIPVNDTNIQTVLDSFSQFGGEGVNQVKNFNDFFAKYPEKFNWKGMNNETPVTTKPLVGAGALNPLPDETKNNGGGNVGSNVGVGGDNTTSDLTETGDNKTVNNTTGEVVNNTLDLAETEGSVGDDDTLVLDSGSIVAVSGDYNAQVGGYSPEEQGVLEEGYDTPPSTDGTQQYGFNPLGSKKNMAFKSEEVDIIEITTYTKFVAASASIKANGQLMTPRQASEWNSHGAKLYNLEHDEELNYLTIKSPDDIAKWEANYRRKANMGNDEALPLEVRQNLETIRVQVEAEATDNMTTEQQALKLYRESKEFQKFSNTEQARFIKKYDLLNKPKYESLEEAALALSLAEDIGEEEDNINRIKEQLKVFENMSGLPTIRGWKKVEGPNGYDILKSGSFIKKGGVLYDPVTKKPVDGVTEALQPRSVDIYSNLATESREYNKDTSVMTELVPNMQSIVDIVAIDPRVLTLTSDLAVFIDGVKKEIPAFTSYLGFYDKNSNGSVSITQPELERQAREAGALGENQTLEEVASDENLDRILAIENEEERLGELKRLYDAKVAIVQFQVGASEGQTNTGLSDKDRLQFNKFMTGTNNAGELGEVFGDFLKTKIGRLDTMAANFSEGSPAFDQFFSLEDAYPSFDGVETLKEQFSSHSFMSKDLMRSYNAIMDGQMVPRPEGERYGDTRNPQGLTPATETGSADSGATVEIDWGDFSSVTPDAISSATKEDLKTLTNSLGATKEDRKAALESIKKYNPQLFNALSERSQQINAETSGGGQ